MIDNESEARTAEKALRGQELPASVTTMIGAQEQECRKISNDLNDGMAECMSSLLQHLHALAFTGGPDADIGSHLQQCTGMTRSAIRAFQSDFNVEA